MRETGEERGRDETEERKVEEIKKNGKQVQHMNEYLFLSFSYICNSHIQSLSFCPLHTPTAAKTEKTERAPESSTIIAIQTTKHQRNMLMSFLMTVAT